MRITGISYLIMSNLAQTASAADAGDAVKGEMIFSKSEAYGWSPDGKSLYVKAPWLRQILRENAQVIGIKDIKDEKAVEYSLEKMTWQMLARAIAKYVYGRKDINDVQVGSLVRHLLVANTSSAPAKLLEKELPSTGAQTVVSALSYMQANKLSAYKGYVESNGKWGKFPDKLSIAISDAFVAEVNKLPAEEAEKPQQAPVAADVPAPASDNVPAVKTQEPECNWFKVQVAVFKPKSMANKLAGRLNLMLREMNSVLEAYVQDNGDGLWGVQVAVFTNDGRIDASRDDAERALKDLTKRFQGEPDLSELKPFIKLDHQCSLSIKAPEEPVRNNVQFFKVWVGTFMDKGHVDNVSSQLRAKGFQVYVRKFDGGVYLAQAGAFVKQGNAETMLRELKTRLCDEPGSDLCKLEPVIKQPISMIKEGDVK